MNRPLACVLAATCFATMLTATAPAQVTVEPNIDVAGSRCQRLTWVDANQAKRSIAVVTEKDREKFWGGYLPMITYEADGKVRECKATGGALGGFGHLVMHGAQAKGWANSKEDSRSIRCESLLDGPHHAIYRATIEVNTTRGVVPCTVDYVVRSGRNDFLWIATFDARNVEGLAADTRSPYGEFDWEGNGKYGDPISGFGWASANKQFRTLGDKLHKDVEWDWTKDCIIPHVIEWKSKDMGDAEMGLVQTQSYDQHDGGGAWWKQYGKSGKGLPENWNLTYQLNAYQGYSSKKLTWMMQYGAVGAASYDVFDGSRKASGKPYQSYSLLCILDKFSDAGVDAAVGEMVTVQTQCQLTATTGSVAAKGPAGIGRDDQADYRPAGWDHVIAAWTVNCAANGAESNLAIAEGAALVNPTFSFTGYSSPDLPPALKFNGEALKADADYFATVDTGERRLLVTLHRKLQGPKNTLAFQGSENKTFPEISQVAVTPADGWEQESTKVTVQARVKDPDNNLQAVTIDLSSLGGAASEPMADQGQGLYSVNFETGKAVTPGSRSLAIRAADADKHVARARAPFEVKEIPTEYAPGVLFDFKDGTAQGWSGTNSKAAVSQEQAFGDSKFSLKIEPGQWGANPTRNNVDLSHCKTLKFQLFVVPEKEGGEAKPFLHLNGKNTNKTIGPGEQGTVPGGKWVECTADLSKSPGTDSIMLQTYGAKAVYIGQVWGDAIAVGKKKPTSAEEKK